MPEKLKKFKGFKLPESEVAVLKELKFMGKLTSRVEVKDNHVVSLNLYKCNLTQIPDPIRDLAFVQVISLAYNKITQIPEFIGDLKFLRILGMQVNPLITLPQWLLNRNPIVSRKSGFWIVEISSIADAKRNISINFDLNGNLALILKDYYTANSIRSLVHFINSYMDLIDKSKLLEYIDQLNEISSENPEVSNRVKFLRGLLEIISFKDSSVIHKNTLLMVWKILDKIGSDFLVELINCVTDEKGFLRFSALKALIHVDNSKTLRDKIRQKITKSKIGSKDLFDVLEVLLEYLSPQEVFELMNKNQELIEDYANNSKELISKKLMFKYIYEDTFTEQMKTIIKKIGHILVENMFSSVRVDNGEIDWEIADAVERILQYVDIDSISSESHRMFAHLLMEEKRDLK